MIPFDRVVVSANEDPLYLPFWPIVAWAYRALFPGIRVTLAFCSDRVEHDPFVEGLRTHGEVVLAPTRHDLPIANQAKMARYWVAMQEPDTITYCDDIDLIPMNREWILSKVTPRPKGHMLFVGYEVYGPNTNSQVPASQMTAEGRVFTQLFNPEGQGWNGWLMSFAGRPGRHEDIASRAHHEGITAPTMQETVGQGLFSDEALIRELRKIHPVHEHHEIRGYNTCRDTVDRSCWNTDRLDHKLQCHTLRPWWGNEDQIRPVLEWIRDHYDAEPWPEPVFPTPTLAPDMEFGGSGLTQEAMQWIIDHIPAGSRILEFGSGHVSTKYLSRFYEVWSVEQNLEFCNLHPAWYIHAPLVNGWYDPEPIRAAIAHRSRPTPPHFDLVILDGPTGDDRRLGILTREEFLSTDQWLLVDDADRPNAAYLAQHYGATFPAPHFAVARR